jgi:hypothetical protein
MNKISDVVKAYDQKNYQSAIELAKPFLNAADALERLADITRKYFY